MRTIAWLCAAVATSAFAAAAVTEPAGRIVLDEKEHDYGRMEQGQQSLHVFTIRNRGQGTLLIKEVVSTCGCAVTLLDTKSIPPGGSARLQVRFISGSLSGSVEKFLRVHSNDPAQPQVTIKVRAFVEPIYIVEPPIVNVGEVPRGQAVTREVRVRDAKGQPFGLPGVTVSHTDLTAEVLPVAGANGSAYRIRLTLNASRNVGPFNFTAIPQTDRPHLPRPLILVTGSVVGPVRVWPPALFLGQVRADQPFRTAAVTVKNSGTTPIEIREVDTGDSAIRAQVSTNTPGREFRVELTTGIMPVGWFQRIMRITTSESAMPVEVPLTGVVLKPVETPRP
jgi:hypothetical protein